MSFLQKLETNSKRSPDLEIFLKNYFQTVYDFFSSNNFNELLKSKLYIKENIILSNLSEIRKLNIHNKINYSYIVLLLDLSETFGFLLEFQILYNHISKTEYSISNRLFAASKFLLGIKKSKDYIDRFDDICELLDEAYLNEEDSATKVIATYINYYSEIIYNFGQFNSKFVLAFREKIINAISSRKYAFINNNIEKIQHVLSIEIYPFDECYIKIKSREDNFISEIIEKTNFSSNEFLIEVNDDYNKKLKKVKNFYDLWRISYETYQSYSAEKQKNIRESIKRGVAILEKEEQLYGYMNSFGKMHNAKLNCAFDALNNESIENNISIIDWACGQGIATISFLEYLGVKNKKTKKINTLLIEPSQISIKRSTLHIKHFNANVGIKTINKVFDILTNSDLISDSQSTKIHLFSNILDVDFYSIEKLSKIVKENFRGLNYFICVSPCMEVPKRERIDSFVNHFKTNSFIPLKSLEHCRRFEWNPEKEWTIFLRVFKVTL